MKSTENAVGFKPHTDREMRLYRMLMKTRKELRAARKKNKILIKEKVIYKVVYGGGDPWNP